jgi:hypothetical protein
LAAVPVAEGTSGLILARTEMAPGTEVVVDINLIVGVEHGYLLRRQVMLETVPNPGQIVLRANQLYGRLPQESVPVSRLPFADGHGRFPWEAGYGVPTWIQPRPGTLTA